MRQVIYKGASDGIFIERVIRDYEFTMPAKHFHEEYEIYYLVKGERHYFIDNRTYHIREGSLVFINSNSIHKTSQAAGHYHDRISIELHRQPYSAFLELTNELELDSFFAQYQGVINLTSKEQHYVCKLLNGIASEIQHKSEGYHIYVMCRLTELLIFAKRKQDNLTKSLNQLPTDTSSTYKKVTEVASYIAKHYASPCSLNSLADRFFVNKSYLSRIFKQITGYTVTEYINISRIQAAKKLLTQENITVNQVARLVGYDSLTYFERMFQKITETSPLKYRKQFHLLNPEARPKTYKSEKL
jgi:AraC-like DNA-binding protein